MDISRAKLFTESFQTTEGENLSLRWAKARLHIAQNMPLYVEPDYELIVSQVARWGNSVCSIQSRMVLICCNSEAAKNDQSALLKSHQRICSLWKKFFTLTWKDKSYAQALPDEIRKFILVRFAPMVSPI